jgi:hypothetical protein
MGVVYRQSSESVRTAQRESLLVRKGKSGRRREIGMDSPGLGAVAALAHRARRTAGRADVLCYRWADTR